MTKPYGAWASPVSADLVAGKSLRFGQIQALGQEFYWTEGRPADGGRATIVRCNANGEVCDILPAPYSARSTVHEYGGGEMLVSAAGVYFVNADDQDVYLVSHDGKISRITEADGWRFADFCLDENRERLIAVAELHKGKQDPAPQNLLVAIGLTGEEKGKVTSLQEGNDFYAAPQVSPQGDKLAWLEWSLPHMPWEAAVLKCATWAKDGLSAAATLAGGVGTAAFQPAWGPGDMLYFIQEHEGWSNIHRFCDGALECICPRDAEFGLPLWVLGARSYAVLSDGRLFVTFIQEGRSYSGVLDPQTGVLNLLQTGLVNVYGPAPLGDGVVAQVASDIEASSIARIDRQGVVEIIQSSAQMQLPSETFSRGEVLCLPGPNARKVWAIYYPPASSDFLGPDNEAPPMLVGVHGGPTGMADRGLKLKIQYWTSRGFAYLDVDYAGSWGYARPYREALNGQWGLADVEDVIAASKAVVARGLADPQRLMISGSSAGGFTVLCALAFSDLYAAGASYYGVADLSKLLDLTHKFESGYLYALTGTKPGATREVFKARSPVNHTDKICSPVIFFQGGEDIVVPPGQSREMVASLEQRGVPVAYYEFKNEGHGFRSGDNIALSLRAEYAFYARVLTLEVAEPLVRLSIKNERALL